MERIRGIVQNYAWGDRSAIAHIQHREPSGEPEAELWLGAHPVAPSSLVDGNGQTLADLVAEEPVRILGQAVSERFASFPFLLKILAAAEPLSIQAHPSLEQAQSGFDAEEAAGVAWNHPARTYRDRNHKPELICALTRFEAKCGFRPLADTVALIGALASIVDDDEAGDSSGSPVGLGELARRLGTGRDHTETLASSLAWLLHLPAPEARSLVAETVDAAARLRDGGATVAGADYSPELSWTAELDRVHPGDIGIVVALLLNHVVLAPGQAMFLEAGNLHAYLRGTGVELMANSDNVIRGGLTAKHIDVDELLAVVRTAPAPPPIQIPAGPIHRFDADVGEFSLTRLVDGAAPQSFEPVGPEVLLVTGGAATVEQSSAATVLTLQPGEAALVEASDGPYRLEVGPSATVWRAAVGTL